MTSCSTVCVGPLSKGRVTSSLASFSGFKIRQVNKIKTKKKKKQYYVKIQEEKGRHATAKIASARSSTAPRRNGPWLILTIFYRSACLGFFCSRER